MEKKRLLGSSDSEDDYSVYHNRLVPNTNYVIEFKRLARIIKDGNLQKLREVLNERNIQLTDSDGSTVLHVAAASNNTDVLSFLLRDKRCSVLLNRQDEEGATPLVAAMLSRSYDTMELLCTHGADPTKTMAKNGKNVLHLATRGCDIRAVEILLKYNSSPEFINAVNSNGDTPLIEAVLVKSPVIDLLLQAGADITIQNPENGRTVLHVVVAYNRLAMLKKLLEHPQATIQLAEIKDVKEDTALLIGVKLDRLEMIKTLTKTFSNLTGINHLDYDSVFHIAIRHDRIDILKILLNSGCTSCKDYLDIENRTPVLYAAELDKAKCLEELIEKGADYNIKVPKTGETFVHIVAKNCSSSSLSYLMSIPDISWFFTQADLQGNTPYMTAVISGNDEFLRQAFKMKQIDLCDENSEGEPPVYYTAKHGSPKTMLTLLLSPRYYYYAKRRENTVDLNDPMEILNAEIRGDIYATDVYILLGKVIKYPLVSWFPPGLVRKTRDDRGVFHACALGGNLEGLEFLYEFFRLFGPKYLKDMFDKPDSKGNTPLLFATQCGPASISCVHFFVTHGADLTATNTSGLNVFNAIFFYNPETAEALINSLLDNCVTPKRNHYYEDIMNISLDFSMLCPKENRQTSVVYMLFNEALGHGNTAASRRVLRHPVIDVFLKDKFRRLKPYLLFRFTCCLIMAVGNSIVVPILYIGDNPNKKYNLLTILAMKIVFGILFAIGIVSFLFKLPYVIQRKVWFTDFVSFLPPSSMLVLLCLGRDFLLAPEISAVIILSSWFTLMNFLTNLYYSYSFQLAVLLRILESISKHLIVLSIMMCAFSLSFFCLYHKERRFSSFPTSFIYTFIVLLRGYFPDVPLFEKEYFTMTPITFRFIVECFIVGTFIVIVVIGFINMLIGLAVRSAKTSETDGRMFQHHHEAHLLYNIEFWFNNKFYFWLLKRGILAGSLKKLRSQILIKLKIDIYDEEYKGIVSDSSIRQLRNIIFNRKDGKKRLDREDSVNYHQFDEISATPSLQTLIRRQSEWEESSSKSEDA